MIVPMKKIILLFKSNSDAEKTAAVEKLRDFGAFHFGLAEDSTSSLEQMEEAFTVLQQLGAAESQEFGSREKNADYYTNKTLRLRGELNGIRGELAQLKATEGWYGQWGAVMLADVAQLAAMGRHIKLYEVALTEQAAVVSAHKGGDVFTVGQDTKVARLALVTGNPEEELKGAAAVSLPDVELADLRDTKGTLTKRKGEIKAQLARLSGRMHIISKEVEEERYRIQFNAVKQFIHATEEIPNVIHIVGYIPKDEEKAFKKLAEAEHWGYTINDPAEDDHPPTLLRNPKWVEPVYMLYKFLGLRIGYRDMDVSTVFMLFYALIAGLLVADAGYGLLFLTAVAVAHAKFRGRADGRYFQLGYVLSGSIAVCGVLTGAWFGSVTIASLPGIRDATIPAIAAFDIEAGKMSNSIEAMMQIGFFIGIVHLVLAHLMKGWQRRKSPVIIGHLGYIAFLIAVYKIICFLIFKEPLPGYTTPALVGGIVTIFVFINSDQGFVQGMKSQAATFVFDIIGGFSDMISYIRIPIVGLVTVVLGSLFNLLFIGAPLGHAFGMILALMGVLIHATRLKSMEFSNHAGMEWNGEWYKPFVGKEKKQWI